MKNGQNGQNGKGKKVSYIDGVAHKIEHITTLF